MKTLKSFGAALCALAAVSSVSTGALAQEAGDFMIRARGIFVLPDEETSLRTGGAPLEGQVDVDFMGVPELDFTYFVADNIALELIAAISPHDVSSTKTILGPLDLASVWVLPPTLLAQYHFKLGDSFKPYVGVGINYTVYFNVNERDDAQSVNFDNDVGFAVQIGADYFINDNWFVNVDLKRFWLDADATVDLTAGLTVDAEVDLDPWVIGFGIGYKF